MLSIFTELGRTEEFFSDYVYPVWPLWLAGAIVLAVALGMFVVRRGWHRTAAAHPLLTGAGAVLLIAVLAFPAYYTISPLFDRNTVCELSPISGAGAGSDKCDGLALAATMPPTASPQPTQVRQDNGPGVVMTPVTTGAPTAVPQITAAPTPEPTAAAFEAHVVRTGTWESADDFHFTIGDALLIETEPGKFTLRVENFSVRNGPDVYVLLSTTNDYNAEALNLGGLKGTDGAFNYEVPEGTDVSQFQSAVIWCKQFNVLFGHAQLT